LRDLISAPIFIGHPRRRKFQVPGKPRLGTLISPRPDLVRISSEPFPGSAADRRQSSLRPPSNWLRNPPTWWSASRGWGVWPVPVLRWVQSSFVSICGVHIVSGVDQESIADRHCQYSSHRPDWSPRFHPTHCLWWKKARNIRLAPRPACP